MNTPATPNLKKLGSETAEFSENLHDASKLVSDVRGVISKVRTLMKLPGQIATASDKLHKVAQGSGVIAKTFAKVGVLKPVADPFSKVIFKVDDRVLAIEKKAKALDKKFKPYIDDLKVATDAMKLKEAELRFEAAATKDLSEKFFNVNTRLDSANLFVQSGAGGTTAEAAKARLTSLFEKVDTGADRAGVGLVAVNDVIEDVKNAVEKLKIDIDLIDFDILENFSIDLDAIAGAFDFLAAPLSAVYDAAGAVIDALGSIFGWILKPLEFALEAILKATGLQDLIEFLGDQIAGLLPDLSFLDLFDLSFDLNFDLNFTFPFELDILGPLRDLIDGFDLPDLDFPNIIPDIDFPDIDPPWFLSTVLGPATGGDDIHLGLLHGDDDQTVPATRGDDLIVGGDGHDLLRGGDDADFLIGGAGDDTLDGGDGDSKAGGDDPRDTVIYAGSIEDYAIVSIIGDDGFGTGTWIFSDYRSDAVNNDGTDTLIGIEDVIFNNFVLPIGELDSFVRTNSVDGERKFVSVGSSNVSVVIRTRNGEDDTFSEETYPLVATPGNDFVYGNVGFDDISTGAGKDQLSSIANGPQTVIKYSPGDRLDGGADNDTFFIGNGSGVFDIVIGGEGEDDIVYDSMSHGLNVFMPSDTRFRPASVAIDVDFDGRANLTATDPQFGTPTVLGVIQGIEHINGTRHDDMFWGTDVYNKIDGGDGDDLIRGLGGDDVLIGGEGDDTIVGDRGDDLMIGGAGINQYVGGRGNDIIIANVDELAEVLYGLSVSSSIYSHEVDVVDFLSTGFADTGHDMPEGIVVLAASAPGVQHVSKYASGHVQGDRIGEDRLEGVDRIIGTPGDDIIVVATDSSQIIFAGDGDDVLDGGEGDSHSVLFGGGGDDRFTSRNDSADTMFGESGSDTFVISGDRSVAGDLIFGDDDRATALEGVDVIDFSGSDYSWHLYFNDDTGKAPAVSKYPLSASFADDPRYIQQTLGVDGVVRRSGPPVDGDKYPEVPFELRVPDANTEEPGGRTSGFGEFEIVLGSQHRDVITVGSPDGAMTVFGNGGADVLFGTQKAEDQLFGGDGDDVLGTLNQDYDSDPDSTHFDAGILTLLDGGKGADLFVAGEARESHKGGEGIDEITFEASRAKDGRSQGVEVNLLTGFLAGGYAEGDVISGIENVTGTEDDDEITGDDGGNLLVGWSGDDTLRGGKGDDALYGNDGRDKLEGGAGNDALHGGNGGDTLDGGAGVDVASWAFYQEHPKGGIDRLIGDTSGVSADLATGNAGADTLIDIENLSGGVGDDRLFGDGIGNAIGGGAGDDVIDGRGGDDVLTGGEGDDEVRGGAGDDWLSGGAGDNLIDGGANHDILDYGILQFGITVEMEGAGTRAGLSTGLVTSHSPIDRAVWTDSLHEIVNPLGRPGATILTGTDETRFTFEVFDNGTDDPSDDTRTQRDPITPDQLFKLFDPTFATRASDLDEVRFLPSDGSLLEEQEFTIVERFVAGTDEFSGIEMIAGGAGDDSFLGNDDDNQFHGSAGADTLRGGGGEDTASYAGSEGAVAVDLTAGTFSGADAEGDLLVSMEHLDGSAFNDLLRGDGEDNRLTGGGGNDTITGEGGTDTAVFDVASTEIIVARAIGAVRIIVAEGREVISDDTVSDDVELFEFTDVTLSKAAIAGLILSGTAASETLIGTAIADNLKGLGGNDRIEGRAGSDVLEGGAGQDTLEGEEGDDTVEGGAGNDHVHGGPDNDSLVGGPGKDHFIGGTGDDFYVLDDATEITVENANEGDDTVITSVTDTLQANVENMTLTGSASLNATGNALANVLVGNSGDNLLRGLGGADSLDGGGGDDTLEGGVGGDVYTLRDGAETVTEAAGQGTDEVRSPVSYALAVNIEALTLIGGADIDGTGNGLDNTLEGNSGDNALSGEGGDDVLRGSAGNDQLLGGDGFDTVSYGFALADAAFDADDPGVILVKRPNGTDAVRGVESFVFTDQTIGVDDLLDLVNQPRSVRLFAASFFENDFGIDTSREGGGRQFLHAGPASQGANPGNELQFTAEAEDFGGRAQFEGSGFLNLANGTATSFRIDFTGGNTTQMSVSGFSKPLLRMIDADWNYWQTSIFNGPDSFTGSYSDDTLIGYSGNDTIFGGLGDKEEYDISDPSSYPSPPPPTISRAGRVADDAAFFVNDGDDFISGEKGDDLLDGGTGNDTILGGVGNDQLWGGGVSGKKRSESDPEELRDIGADLLDGGAGDDTLDGGGGDDTLTGGEGADVFKLTMGMGADIVTDFVDGVDSVDDSGLSTTERAAVTDTVNGDGDRVLTLSDGSTLTLRAPGNASPTGAALIAGEARQGEELAVDPSNLADADGLGTFSRQWLRDGVAIGGATGERYTLAQDDVGRAISVRVSWRDGAGADESVESAPTSPVANINDAPAGGVTLAGDPLVGEVLEARTAGLGDPDGLGLFSYQWERGGSRLNGERGESYLLTEDDVGAGLAVRVSWTDGFGSSETLASAATAAVTVAPVVGDGGANLLEGTGAGELIDGLGGADTLLGEGGDDTLRGGAGDDELRPGLGADRVLTGSGADAIIGSLAELDGITVSDFGAADRLVVEGESFDAGDLTVTEGSAILDIDGDGDGTDDARVTLEGDFSGIGFAVAADGPDTVITISNGPPVARDDAFGVGEAGVLTGSVFAGNGAGADSDPDGDALSVASVNGSTGLVGAAFALASGATLLLRADGTFDYDPSGAFDALFAGETAADFFDYVLSDGSLEDGARATVEIAGAGNPLTVAGTAGDDVIVGVGRDANRFDGGGGSDVLRGKGGDDELLGGGGRDTLDGGSGGDVLKGGGGADDLRGGGGKDLLQGGGGADTLVGGGGVDTLEGGGGKDVISGTGASDRIIGGRGKDLLSGDAGRDKFVFGQGDGKGDRIVDFQVGRDLIEIVSGASSFDEIRVSDRGDDAMVRFSNVKLFVENVDSRVLDVDDFVFS